MDRLVTSDNTTMLHNVQQHFGKENIVLPLDLIIFDMKFLKVFQRVYEKFPLFIFVYFLYF